MKRSVFRGLFVILVGLSTSALAWVEESDQAKFADGTAETTTGGKFTVKVEVSKELLKDKDVWIGVIPVEAPTSIWMQIPKLFTPKSTQVVFLGQENRRLDAPEKFQICICSCKKGALKRGGEIELDAIEKYGMEILASHIIERTK
jgi:hypothetical protein